MKTHTPQADHLHALTRPLFEASSATSEIAHIVSNILVNANLVGHGSHPLDFYDGGFLREFESRNRKKPLKNGVEIPDPIYQQIQEWSDRLNVSINTSIVEPEDSRPYTA